MKHTDSRVEFLYLSQEDVIAAGGLDMAETIKAIEASFRLHASGNTILPPKPVLRWGGPESEETTGRIMAMPAYLGGDLRVAGIKWIPSKPSNPVRHGLPRANALIILNDMETLLPLAVMDGTVVSAMRTGAASGVAARVLARRDAAVLGMVGAGVQMHTQAKAMRCVLPGLHDGRVFDLDARRAACFAREMSGLLQMDIHPVATAAEACRGADVFVTATMSSYAYVEADWYKRGALHCEVSFWDTPAQVLATLDRVVCDDYDQVAHHGVDVSFRAVRDGFVSREKVTNLGDILIGRAPGREGDHEKILFNPIGLGIHDIAEAYRVYRAALERGIGRKLPLWERPHWR
jgi:N-[(2S)-2-amino-2-carboxyethyl]-L-glutamate dehydrogenase